MDRVTLTRFWNLPELISNQNPTLDEESKDRFFCLDYQQKWTIKDNGHPQSDHCYICSKLRYTLIFYERGNHRSNKELFEITDQHFLEKCRKDYILNYSLDCKQNVKMSTPLIFGTPVNSKSCSSNKICGNNLHFKSMDYINFSRKLRMIRADIFSLLSISMSDQFFEQSEDSEAIKRGILKFLESEINNKAESMEIFNKLRGWNKFLH